MEESRSGDGSVCFVMTTTTKARKANQILFEAWKIHVLRSRNERAAREHAKSNLKFGAQDKEEFNK